ncbi:MAG: SpoIID/LytB domain-containing protein, partial [Candidatus Omnitrophica bacterium]|nr:SpoIID/LytB domain-containing protein [Candidatus Omnitrophota bacterium]
MVPTLKKPKTKSQRPKIPHKIKEIFKNLNFWFAVLLVDIFILNFNGYAQSPDYIRVSILKDVSSFRLKIKGLYEVVDLKNNKIFYQGKNLNTTVSVSKEGIALGPIKIDAVKVLIKSDDPYLVMVNGRILRGNIILLKTNNLRLSVINHIKLEDYVKGVLYHEVSHYWPLEALKAQAVVVRTYALYQRQENRQKDYDVTSDIYSQVYGGKTSERYRTNIAVDETEGIILTHQGRIFPTYYHATCGGYTEDASVLWDVDIPPLKGVVCNFCKDSPHFSWQEVISIK